MKCSDDRNHVSARERIRGMLADENPGGLMRLGVIGGGCSGLQYKFRYEQNPRSSDNVFETGGVRLCVDPKSYRFLDGMTLDYVDTILEQRFLFRNPMPTRAVAAESRFRFDPETGMMFPFSETPGEPRAGEWPDAATSS